MVPSVVTIMEATDEPVISHRRVLSFNSKVTLAMTSGFTALSGVAYFFVSLPLMWFVFLGSGAFLLGTILYLLLNR